MIRTPHFINSFKIVSPCSSGQSKQTKANLLFVVSLKLEHFVLLKCLIFLIRAGSLQNSTYIFCSSFRQEIVIYWRRFGINSLAKKYTSVC